MQGPPCSNAAFLLLAAACFRAWGKQLSPGFSLPQAPWGAHCDRWCSCGLRPGLLLAVGGQKRCKGWWRVPESLSGALQLVAWGCTWGAKLGGRLQLPGLTRSWHTPATPKGQVNSPEHFWGICNPDCAGASHCSVDKDASLPSRAAVSKLLGRQDLFFPPIILIFLLDLKRCNQESRKRIYRHVRRWCNFALSKPWETTVPAHCKQDSAQDFLVELF